MLKFNFSCDQPTRRSAWSVTQSIRGIVPTDSSVEMLMTEAAGEASDVYSSANIAVFAPAGIAAIVTQMQTIVRSSRSSRQRPSVSSGMASSLTAENTNDRTRSIPAAGALVKPEDQGEEQLSLL